MECNRAEIKGALLACQEANFLHCYMKDHLPNIEKGGLGI